MNDKNTVTDRKSETVSAKGSTPAQTVETGKVETPATSQFAGMFDGLEDVLATSKSRKSGGTKIRPNIGYTLVAENLKNMTGKSIPGQQQVLLQILKAALLSPAAIVVGNVPVISEPALNKLVVAAHEAGTLKSRQDAWHIFTYYRTSMKKAVKDGGFAVLREVEIPLAA